MAGLGAYCAGLAASRVDRGDRRVPQTRLLSFNPSGQMASRARPPRRSRPKRRIGCATLGNMSGQRRLTRRRSSELPLRTDIRVQLGNMLKDSGRLDEAEAAYRAALAQAPDDADIYLQLGRYAEGANAGARPRSRPTGEPAELAPLAPEPMRDLALLDAINDPDCNVDIGCGSQLRMLSLGTMSSRRPTATGPRSFEPASLIIWFQLAKAE